MIEPQDRGRAETYGTRYDVPGPNMDIALRDWFAGQAITSITAMRCVEDKLVSHIVDILDGKTSAKNVTAPEILANWAYAIADAMLKIRQKEPAP